MRKNKTKFIFYIVFTVFLSLGLSISFQSLLAYSLSPVKNPPDGNIFRRNGLINESNNINQILSKAPMGILSSFQVGSNSFFVNESGDRVGIGTTDPQTSLDVNGLIKLRAYNTSERPVCNAELLGAIYYDSVAERPFVCTSTGWLIF